ncbi:MAG: META domain-containing protein [Fusobacteriaceae bacterium]
MKKLILLLIALFIFMGCFGKKEDISSKVVGNSYILQEVIGDSEIDITFEADRLAGSSGVNRYFANYTLDGAKITIQSPGATLMMGPENLMIQEREYLKNIESAKEVVITERGVTIITKSDKKLNFIKK